MRNLLAGARFLLTELGPLLVFWSLAATIGLKPAIFGALAAILAESVFKLYRREPFTRLYLVVSTLTLAFGGVDLWVRTPFLLAYEAPITNALTGAAFVVGAFGKTPMLQEIAEARTGALPQSEDVRRFFRLFTLLWAAYFWLKAALYLWLAAILPMQEAFALRSLLGGVSLGLMIGLSVTQGRRLFFICQRLGWLGAAQGAR